MIFGPFVVVLALFTPFAALVASGGIAVAAGVGHGDPILVSVPKRGAASSASPGLITPRHLFRGAVVDRLGRDRRPGGDRTWLAIIPGLLVLAIVGGAWLISPVRSPTLI